MNRIPRFAIAMSIAVAAFLCAAVCRQGLIPTLPIVSAAVAGAQNQAPPDQGPDPAAVQRGALWPVLHN